MLAALQLQDRIRGAEMAREGDFGYDRFVSCKIKCHIYIANGVGHRAVPLGRLERQYRKQISRANLCSKLKGWSAPT